MNTEQLREEQEALRAELNTMVLRKNIEHLRGLRESWGYDDGDNAQRQWITRDGLSPTGNVRGEQQFIVQRGDREEGRNPPLYRDELDLLRMLANVRNLATFDSIFLGAAEALNSYTMCGEWAWSAESLEPECPPQLVEAVQREIDKFIEANEWIGELDSEIHDVTREDGECVVGLYPVGDQVRCEYHSAEFLCEPQQSMVLNDYVGCDRPCEWSFGVHVAWDSQLHRWDRMRPLGYHLVFDGAGREWDYLPTWPQQHLEDLRCGTHLKRNVARDALRGVSDYWPVWEDFEGNYKLHKGIRSGATIQSYISYIVKHIEGATRENVGEALDEQPLFQYNAAKPKHGSGRRKRVVPGQIIHIDEGQDFMYSPMGSLNHPIFIDVAQFGLRRLSVRWNMPEYLISGDASNANYASTLSAGSPFVKSRQKDQAWYRRRFRTIFVKMLRIRFIMGAFSGWVRDWDEFVRLVDVQPEAPDVDIQNILELTQRRQILNAAGILDAETWAALEELDPEKVTAPQGGEAPNGQQGPQDAPTGEMSGLGRRQWTNNRKAIDDVLRDLIDGSVTEARARVLLSGLGLTPQNIDALIQDARDGEIDGMPESERFERARKLLWEGYP